MFEFLFGKKRKTIKRRCDGRTKYCLPHKRYNVPSSPCNHLLRRMCRSNSNCTYVKRRGCRRKSSRTIVKRRTKKTMPFYQAFKFKKNLPLNLKEERFSQENVIYPQEMIDKAKRILNISGNPNKSEIRRAYLVLIRKYHPDKLNNFNYLYAAEINNARDILTNSASSFGKKSTNRKKPIALKIRKLCKRLKIKMTKRAHGRRVQKSHKTLMKQIKRKMHKTKR